MNEHPEHSAAEPRPREARKPSPEEKLANLNRSMPCSDEAESGMLSAFLADPQQLLSEARLSLPPEVFYHQRKREVYETLLEMLDAGTPIDVLTLTQRLRDKSLLDKFGGPGAVTELGSYFPVTAQVEFYKFVLTEKWKQRQLINACSDIIGDALVFAGKELGSQVDDLIAAAQERLLALTRDADSKGFRTMQQITADVVEDIYEAYENQGHIPLNRLATGFTSIDRRTGGLEGNCFFVIAARPSMGKTSLAMNIAECVALGKGFGHYKEFNPPPKPVLVFSMEMSAKSLGRRMIVGGAGINLNQVRYGLKSHNDQDALNRRVQLLRKAPIYVVEEGGLSIQQVRSRARIMAKKLGIGLIVIDYLQLMSSSTKRAQQNRAIEIGEISRGCKNMSKELNVPVIALAQLNRNAEDRKGGRPKLSDLREGGDIEQDADIVGLLHRDAYYDDEAPETQATLIIAKGRDIGVGDVPLEFWDATTTFRSTTDSLLSNDPEKRDAGSDAQKRASEKRGGKSKRREGKGETLDEIFPEND